MSKHVATKGLTVPELAARKGGEKIVCLTAYTAPIAALLDPHVDLLLVGDSVGMVLHGLPNTVGVTLDMMILHGQAVTRGATRALVVVDLPFGSYEESREQAFRSAARVMQETGCQAVKLESGEYIAETIAFLVQRGIPVLGHVGLRPQATHVDGGFKAKGRTGAERERVLAEARATEQAGAFAMVVEGVAADLAVAITRQAGIPTIGIGASPECDGQILVTDDVLGLFTQFKPRFVERYAELAPLIGEAAAQYAAEVRARRFPAPEHCLGMQ